MGRLFWKFFLSIWIAQVFGTIAVMAVLKQNHAPAEARAQEAHMRALARAQTLVRSEQSFLPLEPFVAHLVASLLVASLLAHYFSRPIRSLRTAFRNAAAGNLAAGVDHIVARRNDELSDLLREFDRMARQLHGMMESERRLLHDVSHEVRSPLARMQAAIGLARQQPHKAHGMLDRIEREIGRVDRLVEQLLTLARLEASESGALDEEVSIDTVLAEIMDSACFEAQADGKAVDLSSPCHVVVRGNPELLHRAIENVVRNAIRHTELGSRVSLNAALDPARGALRIVICDNGPGVAETELTSIFKPFARGSKAGAHADGHGLGLAIAAQIMKLHRATITASNLPGGGLCVEMALPVLRQNRERSAGRRALPA